MVVAACRKSAVGSAFTLVILHSSHGGHSGLSFTLGDKGTSRPLPLGVVVPHRVHKARLAVVEGVLEPGLGGIPSKVLEPIETTPRPPLLLSPRPVSGLAYTLLHVLSYTGRHPPLSV